MARSRGWVARSRDDDEVARSSDARVDVDGDDGC